MRVLKECNQVHAFREYTTSENYKFFRKRYMYKHNTSDIWYDCVDCADILGTVNLNWYYFQKQYKAMYNSYALVLAYLALFDEEEYYLTNDKGLARGYSPSAFIENFLKGNIYGMKPLDIDMVKKWIKYKEALYGDKDFIVK